MVGSAVCRALQAHGCEQVITAPRSELDLTDQHAVFDFFSRHRPQVQVICAAVVGGIVANDSYPADFIGKNLMMQTNLLEAARRFGCGKTLFMASSCIYPRDTAQPMREEQLLGGALEPTNQWYAVAKIAGVKMGQAYRRQHGLDVVSLLPTNLYGSGDNFDLENAHVIPALMRRFHEAKAANAPQVSVWGSGRARREFMYVEDLAAAALFVLRLPQCEEMLNVGSGEEVTIAELAQRMKDTVGFDGEVVFDATRPDGTPRKWVDGARLAALGWRAQTPLAQGLSATYAWFAANATDARRAVHYE